MFNNICFSLFFNLCNITSLSLNSTSKGFHKGSYEYKTTGLRTSLSSSSFYKLDIKKQEIMSKMNNFSFFEKKKILEKWKSSESLGRLVVSPVVVSEYIIGQFNGFLKMKPSTGENGGAFQGDNSKEARDIWVQRTNKIKTDLENTPNIQFNSMELTQKLACIYFKSAIPLHLENDRNTLVLIELYNPSCCKLKIEEIKPTCETNLPYVRSCTCIVREPRIICKVDAEKDVDILYLNDKTIEIVVERPKRKLPQINNKNNIHVCVHGVIYEDDQNTNQFPELLEEFILHYSNLGVTDIHFYTSSSSHLIDDLQRYANHLGKKTNLWVHDTFFPPILSNVSLTGQERKSQAFVSFDCWTRAVSFGAEYILMLDVDEFLYPSKNNHVTLEGIFNESVHQETVQVVYISSYVFHTHYCREKPNGITDTFKSRLNRMNVARIDSKTYLGRRKAFYHIPSTLADTLSVYPRVHDVLFEKETQVPKPKRVFQALKQIVISQTFHIHHYREPFHDQVCSKQLNEETVKIGAFEWRLHSPEEI